MHTISRVFPSEEDSRRTEGASEGQADKNVATRPESSSHFSHLRNSGFPVKETRLIHTSLGGKEKPCPSPPPHEQNNLKIQLTM